jgi:hypothetical protein
LTGDAMVVIVMDSPIKSANDEGFPKTSLGTGAGQVGE